MTNLQIELVQSSFESVKPIAEVAADLFYTRLFELDPSLRAMFRTDRAEQGRKLMHMIGMAVKGLSRPEQILPAVEELGRRHACYGVRDEHYATVGAALLWTLEQGLGEAFTPDVRAAWTAVYTLLAGTMQRAAASAMTPGVTVEPAPVYV
jgi:hemoglobin-like flavoprotein